MRMFIRRKNELKKKVMYCLLLITWIMVPQIVSAAPANPKKVTFKQPSGEKFEAQTKGDEFFNYLVTDDGNTIDKDEDGFWYYQQKNTNRAISDPMINSNAKVGIDEVPTNVMDEESLLKLDLAIKQTNNQDEKEEEIDQSVTNSRSLENTSKNLVVILVEFNDVKLTTSDEDWSNLIFGDKAPSLKQYYAEQTNNSVDIVPARETNGSVNDGIIRVKLDRNHPNTGRDITGDNQNVTKNAIIEAAKFINLKEYDKDTYFSREREKLHFMIIVAGQDRSGGNPDEPSIWGHKTRTYMEVNDMYDSVVRDYTQFGEKMWSHQSTLGVIVHEFGHDLGLPDLYNIETKNEKGEKIRQGFGIAYTSSMSQGVWGAREGEENGTTPVGLDAYSKSQIGVPVETIGQEGTKKVTAVGMNDPTIYRISSDDPSEYFLVENRQIRGYDEGMQKSHAIHSGGIAIYKINTNYSRNYMPGQQLVTVVEADEGIRGYSYYDRGYLWDADPFYYIGNGLHGVPQQTFLSSTTTPNLKTSENLLAEYNISIEDSPKQEMNVRFEKPISGTYGNVLWSWDEATQTITFGKGQFPDTNTGTIRSKIESDKKLNNKPIKKIVFSDKVSLNKYSYGLFQQLRSLVEIEGLDKVDTSSVTMMRAMFYGDYALTSLDLSSFDTSKVSDMNCMFADTKSLMSLNLSSFDTGNVTDMYFMFYNAQNLQSLEVSSFDTSKVINMNGMFNATYKLQSIDVSSFNTSNVTDMRSMFDNAHSLESIDLSSFDTSRVTSMSRMFNNTANLKSLNISSFDTKNVTGMSSMFNRASSLKSLDLSSFDTSKVTSRSDMFIGTTNLIRIELGDKTNLYENTLPGNWQNVTTGEDFYENLSTDKTNHRAGEYVKK